jgi:CTP:molybdopterin cytidylyltransferase MocA
MYKIVILAVALLFGGCSTAYGTGKVVYKGARTAYIELEIENENIERIDNILVIYDEVRTSVVGEVERQKKQKSVDVDTSLTQEW